MGVVLGCETTPDAFAGPCSDHALVLPAPRALLQWGLGGVRFHAECDFLNGTVIGLVAETIRVCAVYHVFRGHAHHGHGQAHAHGGQHCPLPDFKVSAGFGYHCRSHNSNSARLTELVQVEPGKGCRIQIPPFALSFTVLPVEGAPALIPLTVFGFCGGFKVPYEVKAPLGSFGQHDVENSFPLFNGARYVEIENPSDTDAMSAFVVFGLSL